MSDTLQFTAHDEVQLFGLLAALGAVLVAAAARRLPPAILLVCGGLVLGFLPGVPQLTLPPDLVLVAILPPLLYSSAFFTGLRDLRANLRPISTGVGARPSRAPSVRWLRKIQFSLSTMWMGIRIVLALSASARETACRIHQVA